MPALWHAVCSSRFLSDSRALASVAFLLPPCVGAHAKPSQGAFHPSWISVLHLFDRSSKGAYTQQQLQEQNQQLGGGCGDVELLARVSSGLIGLKAAVQGTRGKSIDDLEKSDTLRVPDTTLTIMDGVLARCKKRFAMFLACRLHANSGFGRVRESRPLARDDLIQDGSEVNDQI